MSISANPKVSSMKYAASASALRRQAVARDRRHASVAHLVLDAAKSCPESVALCSGAKSMTFADLAAESTRLASYLIAHGAGPDVPVGLCLERSFDFIVSAFAVLLSGAAFALAPRVAAICSGVRRSPPVFSATTPRHRSSPRRFWC